jgi:hypothetical protein
MPGDIDEAGGLSVGQEQVRETQVNGDPASFLLREPVCVSPGNGADKRGLAMIDVASRSNYDLGRTVRAV